MIAWYVCLLWMCKVEHKISQFPNAINKGSVGHPQGKYNESGQV